jgi:branched-chain amino acid transport system substrate-binding protein
MQPLTQCFHPRAVTQHFHPRAVTQHFHPRAVTRWFRASAFAALMLTAACLPPGEMGKPSAQQVPKQQVYVPEPAPQSEPVMRELTPERTVKVALLVPMTGKHADLGRAMQEAATLALYDKYAGLSLQQASTQVEILPKDTGDTAEMAAIAAKSAIADGAEVILGPVFSDAVPAVAAAAAEKNVQVITFSNNIAVAKPGVYLFGFTPEAQVERIIGYALSQQWRIAALVPNNPYGQKVLEIAKRKATAEAGVIAPISLYLPQGIGVDKASDDLVKDRELFDALLVPEVGKPLDTVLAALSARGISAENTQLLGTGLWDDPSVARTHAIEGGILASSPPQLTDAFTSRFRGVYGYMPPRIASLSYDAVALSVTLATSGRGFDAETLTSPSGYSGPANGAFRFLPDGTSERGLAVLKIVGGNLEMVSPAPARFR